jgi:Fuc2NAc and GlcNAc transferase
MTVPLLAVAAGAGLTLYLTVRIRTWAQIRLLDVPNERSSHVQPTPRGGGLAIVAAVLGGTAVYATWSGTWAALGPYVAGGSSIAAISFLDDLRGVAWSVRLLAHTLSALLAVVAYTGWSGAALPLAAPTPAIGTAVSLLWIVGLTNAYNFMDGIDGIAASQAVVAGGGWLCIGLLLGRPEVAVTGALVAGASAGFLYHNWPPARIFMGDVGAAFLGYTFAVLPLLAGAADPRVLLAGLLLVALFIFDTLFTFVRRLLAGEAVLRAHRSHLYQRLTRSGATHGAVTLGYAAAAAFLTGVAMVVLVVPASGVLLASAAAILAAGALWFSVVRHERRWQARTRRMGLS